MREFKCKLKDDDYQKVQDIIEVRDLKTDKNLIKHLIDEWWLGPADGPNMSNVVTIKSWLDTWMNNTRANLPDILVSKKLKDLLANDDAVFKGHCLIIGGGPSVFENDGEQLRSIAKNYNGMIMCVDKTLKVALENGIIPDYVITLDPQPIVATWFDHSIIRKHSAEMSFILPVTIDPATAKAIKGEKYFMTGAIDERVLPNVSWAISDLTETNCMDTGLNVGCFAINIALMMHFETIGLVGMEHAYPKDTRPENTQKFMTMVQSVGGTVYDGEIRGTDEDRPVEYEFPCSECDVPEVDCPKDEYITPYNETGILCLHEIHKNFFIGKNEFFGNEYLADVFWQIIVNYIKSSIESYKQTGGTNAEGIEVINCTPAGLLYGEPIIQMHLKDFVEKYV